jgi:hypothetical protein
VARFKGLVLLNARDFCVQRFGERGWAEVLSRLPSEDRAVVDSAVHVGWYDIAVYDRLHAAIAASVGSGPDAVMVELGHSSEPPRPACIVPSVAAAATPCASTSSSGSTAPPRDERRPTRDAVA